MQAAELLTEGVALRRQTRIGFSEHLIFFDTDGDGFITLEETRRGLARLGIGTLINLPGALTIHFGVAGLSLFQAQLLSPLSLRLPKTGLVRHPDTGMVDRGGAFQDVELSAAFRKYARRFQGEALTAPELFAMAGERLLHEAGRDPKALLLLPLGVGAVALEWGFLLFLAGEFREGRRVLSRAALQRFYTDPQFFHDVAKHTATLREERAGRLLGRVRNFVQRWLL